MFLSGSGGIRAALDSAKAKRDPYIAMWPRRASLHTCCIDAGAAGVLVGDLVGPDPWPRAAAGIVPPFHAGRSKTGCIRSEALRTRPRNDLGLDLDARQTYDGGSPAVVVCGQVCGRGHTAELRAIDCSSRRRRYHGGYTLGKWQVHV
jgi:hypothetical protein